MEYGTGGMSGIRNITGVVPYTLALFLNAFTDLGHKIILQNTVFKIYDDQTQIIYTAILNALILLPFIFLFTPAGFLSHRFSKVAVMRYGALAAIVITTLITLSYYQGWFIAAFVLTFVLAAQSAIYSPAKYGYIKEISTESGFAPLNALVQSVTTVAILSGIMVYTVLFENSLHGEYTDEGDVLRLIAPVGWLLVGGSVIEYAMTLRLMETGNAQKITFNIKKYLSGFYLRRSLLLLRRDREIFDAILFLSLFWSISQVILAAFGAYAKRTLEIENTIIVQGLMALAAFGIIAGSFVTARLSRHYLHKGLIVSGALIITVMLMVLPLTRSMTVIGSVFFGFGIGGAMMIVSLNALVQSKTSNARLSYVLSANNWVQNLFMTVFLVLTTFFAFAGWDSLMLFYVMLAVSAFLTWKVLARYKDYFLWLVFESLLSLRYNIIPMQTHNIPRSGPVLLMGNHISWIDWILVQVGVERRIRYLMERSIYQKPFIRPIMELGEVIPISQNAAKESFKEAKNRLKRGDVVAIFPEGTISYSGEIGKIYPGYRLIATEEEGCIVPFWIDGVYGSVFSRSDHRFVPSRGWFRRNIRVIYGEPLPMISDPETVYNAINSLKESYGSE